MQQLVDIKEELLRVEQALDTEPSPSVIPMSLL